MSKIKKFRIDVDEDQSLDLEMEASSGIWRMVVEESQEMEISQSKTLEVEPGSRSSKRELLETPFFKE